MKLPELKSLVAAGESERLEFKRTTGEMKEAMQTLCAFLNGTGGVVLFGVRPDGTIEGQEVSDQTLQDIAQSVNRFEPPAHVSIRRVKIMSRREVIAVTVDAALTAGPFTYEGRAYERVSATTRRMPQARYEKLLLDRAHGRRRWENEPADGVMVKDIDRDEVFRIVEAAKSAGRLIGPVGTNLVDVLDRLKLRRDGRILQAAVVLFGKEFLPDYPQCELRMARFRGVDKTEFLDQRNVRAPAFKLLEEAQLFCQRHFPLPGKIVPGRLQRVDKPLIPPDAMREILVNALIHRDYSIVGGASSLAIFDDRVEVWSAGTYPTGITPDQLSKSHQSVQRNPIIADIFNRAGLIEKWGRGTNRVIDMCRQAGIPTPTFEEITGAAVVTFKVNVLGAQGSTQQVTTQVTTQVTMQVTTQVAAVLRAALQTARSGKELQKAAGIKNREHFRKAYLEHLLSSGWLERTIADKPRSRMQRYRLTPAGEAALKRAGKK